MVALSKSRAAKQPPRAALTRPTGRRSNPALSIAPTPARRAIPDGLRLFKNNNTKLGPGIFSWSIPAVATCPGATAACLAVCYASRGTFSFRDVKAHYARNLELSRTDTFVDEAIAELRARKIEILRVHVAGDFYDVAYATKWAQIALACPETRFFVYTRSWRVAGFRPVLRRLAALPNVQLWLSEDRDSGRAPAIAGARVAYMAPTAEDEQRVPAHADLVFRHPKHGAKKKINAVQVCPYEDGLARKIGKIGKIGCSRCGICYNPPRPCRPETGLTSIQLPEVSLPVLTVLS